MARQLGYTDMALADLVATRRWLTQSGAGSVGLRRMRAIRAAIDRLREYPCLHPLGQHAGVRELICDGSYRILYEVHPDTAINATAGDVRVLRLYGPGQHRSGFVIPSE